MAMDKHAGVQECASAILNAVGSAAALRLCNSLLAGAAKNPGNMSWQAVLACWYVASSYYSDLDQGKTKLTGHRHGVNAESATTNGLHTLLLSNQCAWGHKSCRSTDIVLRRLESMCPIHSYLTISTNVCQQGAGCGGI